MRVRIPWRQAGEYCKFLQKLLDAVAPRGANGERRLHDLSKVGFIPSIFEDEAAMGASQHGPGGGSDGAHGDRRVCRRAGESEGQYVERMMATGGMSEHEAREQLKLNGSSKGYASGQRSGILGRANSGAGGGIGGGGIARGGTGPARARYLDAYNEGTHMETSRRKEEAIRGTARRHAAITIQNGMRDGGAFAQKRSSRAALMIQSRFRGLKARKLARETARRRRLGVGDGGGRGMDSTYMIMQRLAIEHEDFQLFSPRDAAAREATTEDAHACSYAYDHAEAALPPRMAASQWRAGGWWERLHVSSTGVSVDTMAKLLTPVPSRMRGSVGRGHQSCGGSTRAFGLSTSLAASTGGSPTPGVYTSHAPQNTPQNAPLSSSPLPSRRMGGSVSTPRILQTATSSPDRTALGMLAASTNRSRAGYAAGRGLNTLPSASASPESFGKMPPPRSEHARAETTKPSVIVATVLNPLPYPRPVHTSPNISPTRLPPLGRSGVGSPMISSASPLPLSSPALSTHLAASVHELKPPKRTVAVHSWGSRGEAGAFAAGEADIWDVEKEQLRAAARADAEGRGSPPRSPVPLAFPMGQRSIRSRGGRLLVSLSVWDRPPDRPCRVVETRYEDAMWR